MCPALLQISSQHTTAQAFIIPTLPEEAFGNQKIFGLVVKLCQKRSHTLKLFDAQVRTGETTIHPTQDHTISRFRYAFNGSGGEQRTIASRYRFWHNQPCFIAQSQQPEEF